MALIQSLSLILLCQVIRHVTSFDSSRGQPTDSSTAVSQLTTKLDAMNHRLDGMDRLMNRLNREISLHDERIDKVEAQDRKLASQQQRLETHDQLFVQMRDAFNNLRNETYSYLESLNTDVDRLDAKIYNKDLMTADPDLKNATRRIDALEIALGNDRGQTKTQIDRIRHDTHQSAENLEYKLAAHKEAVKTQFGHVGDELKNLRRQSDANNQTVYDQGVAVMKHSVDLTTLDTKLSNALQKINFAFEGVSEQQSLTRVLQNEGSSLKTRFDELSRSSGELQKSVSTAEQHIRDIDQSLIGIRDGIDQNRHVTEQFKEKIRLLEGSQTVADEQLRKLVDMTHELSHTVGIVKKDFDDRTQPLSGRRPSRGGGRGGSSSSASSLHRS